MMRASPASTYFLLLLLLLATADSTQGQWTDKVTDTPSLIQTDFGPYGKYLPGNGESFCAPTSATMSLYWLARNGFTQLASTNLADAANLDRVLGGLMGTTPAGGTDENGYYNGFMTYLSARGISPAQVTRVFTPNPDVHWLATNNFNQSVVNFSVGWYYASPSGQTTNYINNGGHVLTLLAANPAAQIVTINNAYPASFFPVPNVPSSNPQTVTLASVPTSWTLQYLDTSIGYTQVITPDLGPATGGLAVLWGADSWTLNINALPAKPAYIARTWILSGLQQINTDEGHLEVIAPIAGSGGLTKLGEGTLRLLKKNSSTGDYRATDGVLATQAPVDTPFGSGSMHINGDAMVLIKPDDVTPAEVSMQIASGDQRYLGISLGAGKLMFDRGTNHSLSVTIGGNTNGTGSNLLIDHPAALVVVPRHGLAELGNTEQLIVNGHDHNLPEVSNGMVTPALAAANNDPNGSLAFLTYDATKGFLPAELISSAALNINESTSSTKYSVDTPQSVDANSTAEVAALAVNGQIVASAGGQTVLNVGSQESGHWSGVLLNSGTIEVSALNFGAANAYIGASGPTNVISSTIQVGSTLAKFGDGDVWLTGSNNIKGGGIRVSGGRLLISGSTEATAVAVDSDATLGIIGKAGVVQSPITLLTDGAKLLLGGGQAAEVDAKENSIISGWGTIGTAKATNTVAGLITAGPVPGELVFAGRTYLSDTAEFYWTLAGLHDDANPGTTPWNRLTFNNDLHMDHLQVYLNFTPETDPDSGNPFWQLPHTWTLWQFKVQPDWYFQEGNFDYSSGSFSITWNSNVSLAFLQFKPASPVAPTASIRVAADKITVTITYSGVLYESDSLAGPWLPVEGANPSTYIVPTNLADLKFYRAYEAEPSSARSSRRPDGFRLNNRTRVLPYSGPQAPHLSE